MRGCKVICASKLYDKGLIFLMNDGFMKLNYYMKVSVIMIIEFHVCTKM